VIEAPREALRHIAGEFIELPENRMDVRCCGGGGLLQAANNDLRLSIINNRLSQAKELGAEIVVSACPSCKLAFVDGVRASGDDIEILDLMELAARQLDLL
jgi:Fe-S oxidoreductase